MILFTYIYTNAYSTMATSQWMQLLLSYFHAQCHNMLGYIHYRTEFGASQFAFPSVSELARIGEFIRFQGGISNEFTYCIQFNVKPFPILKNRWIFFTIKITRDASEFHLQWINYSIPVNSETLIGSAIFSQILIYTISIIIWVHFLLVPVSQFSWTSWI